MRYFRKRKFSRLFRREKLGTGALASADVEGGIGHGDKLSPDSDFTQEIVPEIAIARIVRGRGAPGVGNAPCSGAPIPKFREFARSRRASSSAAIVSRKRLPRPPGRAAASEAYFETQDHKAFERTPLCRRAWSRSSGVRPVASSLAQRRRGRRTRSRSRSRSRRRSWAGW